MDVDLTIDDDDDEDGANDDSFDTAEMEPLAGPMSAAAPAVKQPAKRGKITGEQGPSSSVWHVCAVAASATT